MGRILGGREALHEGRLQAWRTHKTNWRKPRELSTVSVKLRPSSTRTRRPITLPSRGRTKPRVLGELGRVLGRSREIRLVVNIAAKPEEMQKGEPSRSMCEIPETEEPMEKELPNVNESAKVRLLTGCKRFIL